MGFFRWLQTGYGNLFVAFTAILGYVGFANLMFQDPIYLFALAFLFLWFSARHFIATAKNTSLTMTERMSGKVDNRLKRSRETRVAGSALLLISSIVFAGVVHSAVSHKVWESFTVSVDQDTYTPVGAMKQDDGVYRIVSTSDLDFDRLIGTQMEAQELIPCGLTETLATESPREIRVYPDPRVRLFAVVNAVTQYRNHHEMTVQKHERIPWFNINEIVVDVFEYEPIDKVIAPLVDQAPAAAASTPFIYHCKLEPKTGEYRAMLETDSVLREDAYLEIDDNKPFRIRLLVWIGSSGYYRYSVKVRYSTLYAHNLEKVIIEDYQCLYFNELEDLHFEDLSGELHSARKIWNGSVLYRNSGGRIPEWYDHSPPAEMKWKMLSMIHPKIDSGGEAIAISAYDDYSRTFALPQVTTTPVSRPASDRHTPLIAPKIYINEKRPLKKVSSGTPSNNVKAVPPALSPDASSSTRP